MTRPYYYLLPGGAEPIDIAEHLSFNGGNVVKYVARACRTDGVTKATDLITQIEDLNKARFYIDREIKRLTPLKEVMEP